MLFSCQIWCGPLHSHTQGHTTHTHTHTLAVMRLSQVTE